MSSKSSPARSSPGSTTSSPSKSQHHGSPQQLTPRSKIKALLAAVDDDSDTQQSLRAERLSTSGRKLADKTARNTIGSPRGSSTESESSADELAIPRGKLAARLQPKGPAITEFRPPQAATEDGEREAGNAYERIKRKLLPKVAPIEDNGDKPSSEQESVDDEDKPSPEQESVDDEDNGPIVPRRRRKVNLHESDTLRSPLPSPIRTRTSSPGLFLTPGKASDVQSPSSPAIGVDSDSDLPANPETNERFLALLARKKAEREAREAAETQKRAARDAQYKQQSGKGRSQRSATPLEDSDDDSDDVGAKKLTQQARPTRKASKKALEEMNRETQRMNRNMQLAHQARTKKTVTKESLFARFNFRTVKARGAEVQQVLSSPTVVSSAHASEAEGGQQQDTPPTSPAPQDMPKQLSAAIPAEEPSIELSADQWPVDEEELPTFEDIMNQPMPALDKGKAVEPRAEATLLAAASDHHTRKAVKARFPKPSARSKQQETSDSDLEIIPARKSKASKLDAFDRNSTGKPSEARSLQTLRALAHLNSPGKESGKSRVSMTLSDMQMSLQKRARQQAAAERAEKIQDLKNRGIIVQTAEERQKDQVEVEDLVENARREAADVKKKEKDAAKKEAKKNGEEFNDSSDDDEDYQANEADESEIELSGSEDEGEGSASEQDEKEAGDDEDGGVGLDFGKQTNSLVEDEAVEDAEDEESEIGENADEAIDSDQEETRPFARKPRVNRTIDEEDEETLHKSTQNKSPVPETPQKLTVPAIALGTSPGLMGMTQAFAATMADSQTQALGDRMDMEQGSMSFLGSVPEPNIPLFDSHDSESMILDSQADAAQASKISDINLDYTQTQMDYEPLRDTQDQPVATQELDIPEPTQDMGFHLSSPAGNRFASAPPSTADTVPLQQALIKRKGRLRRRRKNSVDLSDDGALSAQGPEEFEVSASAFDVMKKKRTATVNAAFDKKKSHAKEMVEEQAQESEDEYAGLGGASDDESAGEEDEELKRMIEEGEVEVDERKLASYHADRERASDEQAISKLHKDLANGGLRRKRGGADFDLSDSDDDAEARQRAKRRANEKARQAMLADEKLGKIAEDPKKVAFLRSVEDREHEEDLGIGWEILGAAENGDGDKESTQEVVDSQASQPANAANVGVKRKRPLQESLPDAANRPPPAARRTKGKKPATLAEIRESVSFLTETPESMSFQSHAVSSDIEDENEEENRTTTAIDISTSNDIEKEASKEAMPPPPLPHHNPRRTSAPIIDRLSLKRAASAESQSSATRFAFAAPSTTSTSPFHVPSLLRRASTSAIQADNNHGITTLAATEQAAGGGDAKESYVKKGGRKGSSILGQAREMERRAVLDGVEKRRREERERIARLRRSGFVAGGGSWEG